MFPPIQVDAEKLRAASQRLRQLAPSADGIPDRVERTSSDAKSANDGFLTADACEKFAERTTGTATTLGNHVKAMAEPIAESAQAWEDSDDESRSEIGKYESEIGKAHT
ncbi:type VII secretion target [Glycomyces buryatensis]|nr:type VII secretion target [Glycomyces buryatensis]